MFNNIPAKVFAYVHSMGTTNKTFLNSFPIGQDCWNGLKFNESYIPEEIILTIFTYLDPNDILKCFLVCKLWHNIAKSNTLWQRIYNKKEYPKKAKTFPWYVFYCYFTNVDYFSNIVKNGNGEEEFKHWKTIYNGGDGFVVEKEPQGSDPLPEAPEFNGHTSCFATSYLSCLKLQKFDLTSNKLLRYIIEKYRPVLYASEWYAGRFDCACAYQLTLACETRNDKWEPCQRQDIGGSRRRYEGPLPIPGYFKTAGGKVEQWAGRSWEKVEIFYDDYPRDTVSVYFSHEGKDLQLWAGHYGSKMAGGVLKFIFESIQPTPDDIDNNDEDTNHCFTTITK